MLLTTLEIEEETGIKHSVLFNTTSKVRDEVEFFGTLTTDGKRTYYILSTEEIIYLAYNLDKEDREAIIELIYLKIEESYND